ncbi:MAG: AMP-binding protein [Baekduia sp.]
MIDLRLHAARVAAIARSGYLSAPPHVLAGGLLGLHRYGPAAGAVMAAGRRFGDRTLLIDENGALSARELDERSTALAHWLIADGAAPGDGAGILCRNHRGFCDALFAASKAGLRCVLLNTEFAAPQLEAVCAREGIGTLIVDDDLLDRVPASAERVVSTSQAESLIEQHRGARISPPAEHAALVVLTSGTTGTPKGAPRENVSPIVTIGALLGAVPFRNGQGVLIAPPLFHSLGLATLMLNLGLGSPVVLRRRFEADAVLDDLARTHAGALVVVPVMLQRLLDAKAARPELELPDLELIMCGGAQLSGPLATRTLDALGDVLHVMYGSTEVAYATCTTPADLRDAPTTVGRPCLGATVRLFDSDDRELTEQGATGRIFVGNGNEFAGYTDGSAKHVIDGLIATGDVGHFDAAGRLFIDGRDDEMIVSGGENVFPAEVEDLLAAHPAIADVSVIGAEDETWGHRLVAFAVPAGGHTIDPAEIKEHVRERLARYKVPRDVIVLDELPRNATGKVLKRVLREQL